MAKPQKSELPPRLNEVREVIQAIEKALRGFRLYQEGHSTLRGFVQEAQRKLAAELSASGPLVLQLKPQEMIYEGQTVYQNREPEDNLCYRFFQDGVRQLTFNPGFSLEEMEHFLRVLRADFRSFEMADEDSVTLLWKAHLRYLSFIAVETFLEGEGGQVEVFQKQVEELEQALMGAGHPFLKPPSEKGRASGRRLRPSDVQELAALPSLEPAVGAAAIQADQQFDEEDRGLILKTAVLLMRVMLGEEDEKEFERAGGLLLRFLDSLLSRGQFEVAARIAGKLRELTRPEINPSLQNIAFLRYYQAQLFTAERLGRLPGFLAGAAGEGDKGLSLYLSCAPDENFPLLCQLLPQLPNGPPREGAAQLLVAMGKRQPAAVGEIAGTLKQAGDGEILVLLPVLSQIGSEESRMLLRKLARHPKEGVRLKAIEGLGQADDSATRHLLLDLLQDESAAVRFQCLKVLSRQADREVGRRIKELLATSGLEERDGREQAGLLGVLAKADPPEALAVCGELLRPAGLLERSRPAATQLAAIRALSLIDSPQAEEVLRRFSAAGEHRGEVAEALQQALARLTAGGKHGQGE